MFQGDFNYLRNEAFENVRYGNRLQVFGKGVVSAVPDMARVMIGIITENQQLDKAQKENARISSQVINNIKSMGVPQKDIQTQNYSIETKYDYIEGRQVFKGYTVSNYLNVLISDINTVGEIIDAAVKGGANAVNNISFMVSDTPKYYNEALKLAVKDAQSKAVAIASRLKVNLNLIPKRIVEQGRNAIVPITATYKASETSTPIEVGENKIIASIEAVFIYVE